MTMFTMHRHPRLVGDRMNNSTILDASRRAGTYQNDKKLVS